MDLVTHLNMHMQLLSTLDLFTPIETLKQGLYLPKPRLHP